MGSLNLDQAKRQVENCQAEVERDKKSLEWAKSQLAKAKASPNWKTCPKNCGYPGKSGSYRSYEVDVFRCQDQLAKSKKRLADAKADLARAKKK